MRAFHGLSEDELQQLAVDVLELRRAGMQEEMAEQLRQTGEVVDEATTERWAAEKLEQARPLEIPEPAALDDPERLAEGRRVYEQAGCIQCHGPDGHGAFDVPMLSNGGSHAIPRDLVGEPMKGGDMPEDLFARLRLGMPGKPHPACATLDDDELMSLVAYCLSLAAEPKPTRTNWQRALDANRRAIQAKQGG